MRIKAILLTSALALLGLSTTILAQDAPAKEADATPSADAGEKTGEDSGQESPIEGEASAGRKVHGYSFGDRYRPDPDRATDPNRKESLRLRLLDEVGRYGDKSMAPKLHSALSDKSPAIRIATMQALMRLGLGGSENELMSMLRDSTVDPKERAWAARSLSRSKDSQAVVPELISALKRGEMNGAPGERAAVVESLRRMTGLSLGARPKTLFTSIVGDQSKDTTDYANKWQAWWEENKNLSPDEWMQKALSSEIPKDRASAARVMAQGGKISDLPMLLKALQREAEEGGKSGVREALARSLEKLTGVKPKYSAYREKDQSEEEWEAQHDEALREWQDFDRAVRVEKKNPFEMKLASESPRTRAAALRTISFENRSDVAILSLIERLEDESHQVAEEAVSALERSTGIYFPLDFDAPAALIKVQKQRWKEWAETYARSSAAERLTSIFREPAQMRWGLGAALGDKAIESLAIEELEKRIVTIRSRAIAFAARNRVRLGADVLVELFRKEIRAAKTALDNPRGRAVGVHSMLQRNIILAFGQSNDGRIPSLLLERLQIAEDSRRMGSHAGTLNDIDVVKACVQSLGNIGDLPSAASKLRTLTDRVEESRFSVRARAALALGQCGGAAERGHLVRMLEDASENTYARIGAVDGLSALATRYPNDFNEIKTVLWRLWKETKDINKYPTALRDAGRKAWNFLESASSGD